MQTFVKINIGDYVYDKNSKKFGEVININNNNVKSLTETGEEFEAHISQLTKLTKKSEESKGADHLYDLVEVFQTKFNHPVAKTPTPMTLERGITRSTWTGEEALVEFLHSSSNNEGEFLEAYNQLLEGLEKAKEKSLKDDYPVDNLSRIIAQTDALTDALYFLIGSFIEIGVKPNKPFEIVQDSNMSKLFTDEKGNKFAKYRESDGKVLKSPEFFAPESKLKEEIQRQINLSN